MREFPRGGLIGKGAHLIRRVAALQVPLYAAGACFFLVLAVFPGLLLLLGLLRYTPLEVERLGEMLALVLPEALRPGAEELILLTYDNLSGTAISVSAVTALWSAGRGVYGLIIGLNGVYGLREDRGWLRLRLISGAYTFVFLLVVLLTLALHVFGSTVVELLRQWGSPFLRFLLELVDLRFFLLLLVQSAIFAVMFMALPNRRVRLVESLPGALLASSGWLVFSDLYSIYVTHFAGLSNVYGSVYALALAMLWIYCCISIFFYGGALNACLADRSPG